MTNIQQQIYCKCCDWSLPGIMSVISIISNWLAFILSGVTCAHVTVVVQFNL